ncbi:hypothetical protein PDIG_90650 [Penicillium digitatum PHI26]|uniref:Uncharacterized protein n=2 Tax=Penicillium digitatum TaxID=36651 RepID=K9FSY8_PEND2|nr:hypothetical protein PDIP_07570 [Penicillium digitatum Pd1]EKV04201.1 hypothetical protein PDIG_90650 [Penicillium digitatum PHI26]EKV21328.1 hypothetical protein PDIP_07570 [Penicillium digitatum Pd1]
MSDTGIGGGWGCIRSEDLIGCYPWCRGIYHTIAYTDLALGKQKKKKPGKRVNLDVEQLLTIFLFFHLY